MSTLLVQYLFSPFQMIRCSRYLPHRSSSGSVPGMGLVRTGATGVPVSSHVWNFSRDRNRAENHRRKARTWSSRTGYRVRYTTTSSTGWRTRSRSSATTSTSAQTTRRRRSADRRRSCARRTLPFLTLVPGSRGECLFETGPDPTPRPG